jgi:hypothetical protein
MNATPRRSARRSRITTARLNAARAPSRSPSQWLTNPMLLSASSMMSPLFCGSCPAPSIASGRSDSASEGVSSASARGQLESLLQPGENRGRRHHPTACGRELDGERKPVEPCTDRRDRGQRLAVERKPRLTVARAIHEELDGRIRLPAVRDSSMNGERRDEEFMLAANSKPNTARDRDRETPAGRKEPSDLV